MMQMKDSHCKKEEERREKKKEGREGGRKGVSRMRTKFLKWVTPKNGAKPYVLVEFCFKNEKKLLRIDSKRVWEEYKEEMIKYAKNHWEELDRFVESEE